MSTDATRKTLDKFLQAEDCVVIKKVPIFDAHEEKDKDGKTIRRFGRKELDEIVKATNDRQKKTGDLILFGPGHTLGDLFDKSGQLIRKIPETEQPEVWGAFTNCRVDTFGPEKNVGIVADMIIRKEKYKQSLEYPRRSIELWPQEKVIDWVALLRRAPQRDLGLLMFNRCDVIRFEHSIEDKKMENMPVEPVASATGLGSGGPDDALMEAVKKALEILLPQMLAGMSPEKFSGFPGGANTTIPGSGKIDMSRQGDLIAYVRQETSKNNEELQKLRLAYERERCENVVRELERQGYEFDREVIVNRLIPLDESRRKSEVESIMRFNRKSTTGGFIPTYQGESYLGTVVAKDQEPSPEQHRKAISIATSKGISYDEALKLSQI